MYCVLGCDSSFKSIGVYMLGCVGMYVCGVRGLLWDACHRGRGLDRVGLTLQHT